MNFLTLLLDSLVTFVRRNPITCLVMVVLAIVFPSVFRYAMWAVLAIAALLMLAVLLLVWRLHRVRRQMEQQIRDAQSRYYDDGRRQSERKEEGDVSVHRTASAPEKKINSDVGEYVDFEEEKEN